MYRGVNDPESIAGHMYRMAVMALLVREEGVDGDRVMKIAIVHDMAGKYSLPYTSI